MIKHIRIYPLIIGIVIGFISVVLVRPSKNVVYKYPTAENAGKIIYKDKNDVCYKYNFTEVDCNKNGDRLKPYPLNK